MLSRLALALVAVSGCLLPRYDGSGTRCDTVHPCPGGLSCVVGFCGAACESPPAACSGPDRPCITTLAGSGGPGRIDGPPSIARFRGPTNLLALPEGALVVADTGNHALRKVPLDGGAITTLAGDGKCDPLNSRSLCEPHGLALGARGELYVTALGSDSVMRVENGQAQRLIGTGLPNELVRPEGVAFASGRLAVTRTNYCEVRFYELDGGRARDGAGALVPALGTCGMLDGRQLGWVELVAVSLDAGTLFFGDSEALWSAPLQNGVPAGPARFLTGQDEGFRDGVLSQASFDNAEQIWPTASGLLLADTRNHRVRRLELLGDLSTLAGSSATGLSDGPATGAGAALLHEPAGVAEVGSAVYFTSPVDHRLRKLEGGEVTTVAGGPAAPLEDGCAAKVGLALPTGVDIDPNDGTIYFTDTLHHAVRALGTNGTVVTLLGGAPGSRGGEFASARLHAPKGLAVLPDGGVLVADTGNGLIVQLDVVNRRVSTLVGAERQAGFTLPGCVPSLDNPPRTAQLCAPKSLALGRSGELYFTDSAEPGQGKIGRLSADGTQLAELVNAWFSPRGITVAPNGNIVVSDVNTDDVIAYDPMGRPVATLVENDACGQGQSWARRCTPSDVAYVGDELVVVFQGASSVARRPVAGTALIGLAGAPFERGLADGAFDSRLDGPSELSVTDAGWLISDSANHRLRLLLP